MTANERMNRGRYHHFLLNKGKSPYSKGPLTNLAEFFNCTCFGYFKYENRDWLTSYDFDKNMENHPLLRQKDNYQYV